MILTPLTRGMKNGIVYEESAVSHLAPVVQTLDSAIQWINHYPLDNSIGLLVFIRWIVIYPVDSAIHRLKNWGQMVKSAACGNMLNTWMLTI